MKSSDLVWHKKDIKILFPAAEKRQKYGARKTVVDGITFDSKKEAGRYSELKMLERAGKIRGIELQKKFQLIPPLQTAEGKRERAIVYIADFVYQELASASSQPEKWVWVIEDVKGFKTQTYSLKRRMLLWLVSEGRLLEIPNSKWIQFKEV